MAVQVISFNCILKNKTGQFISETYNREVLTSGSGQDTLLAGLANGLQDLIKGEKRTISLRADEAYGFYDLKKVILFPRKKLPQQIIVGQVIGIAGTSGTVRSYKVLKFHDSLVSLDGNHPLAGQDLIFEIETLEARSATEDEVLLSVNPVETQILH